MYVYRIYTKDIDRAMIAGVTAEYFPGFSMIPCVGYWRGAEENSLIVEIVVEGEHESIRVQAQITGIARYIKVENKQDAVLITCQKLDGIKYA